MILALLLYPIACDADATHLKMSANNNEPNVLAKPFSWMHTHIHANVWRLNGMLLLGRARPGQAGPGQQQVKIDRSVDAK